MPPDLESRLLDLLDQQRLDHKEGMEAVASAIRDLGAHHREDTTTLRDDLDRVVEGLGEVKEGLAEVRGSMDSLKLIRPLLIVTVVAVALMAVLAGAKVAMEGFGLGFEGDAHAQEVAP